MLQIPMYSPVGDHQQNASLSSMQTIRDTTRTANAVLIQALSQNIRITLSGPANGAIGFRITAGADAVLLPLGGSAFNAQEEAATATLEYQFVKVQGMGY